MRLVDEPNRDIHMEGHKRAYWLAELFSVMYPGAYSAAEQASGQTSLCKVAALSSSCFQGPSAQIGESCPLVMLCSISGETQQWGTSLWKVRCPSPPPLLSVWGLCCASPEPYAIALLVKQGWIHQIDTICCRPAHEGCTLAALELPGDRDVLG